MCCAEVDVGRAQEWIDSPSLRYMNVLACSFPSKDAVARVTVFTEPR
jgi:hypothetical protein